ncbi:MAG: type II secretion system protein [Planctomycetes bacterium]|nr:type II secretion system protein [Planctomycetota bacterium]
MKNTRRTLCRSAFTVIELLVVVSIIALLVSILLPAIGKAREQAHLTRSVANLRNLAAAHQSYAAAWADRQFTLVNDNIASYGGSISAFHNYYLANGGTSEEHCHEGPILGWGYLDHTGPYRLFIYRTHETNDNEEFDGNFNSANASLNLPIAFNGVVRHFGSFRLINVQQFHRYVSGKFYDPVYYAPKDVMVLDTVNGEGFGGSNCFDDPGEYCDRPDVAGIGEIPAWSSYCLSPAAMFAPQVFARDDPDDSSYNGWRDPWSMPGGFRSPSFSQCLFPSLKTHMLEHHWLQNVKVDCNPGFDGSIYAGCEPYYFNHASTSAPVTLFYDGHVGTVGTRDAVAADGRMRTQTGNDDWGLWSRDSAFGLDGYLSSYGYDNVNTSFHILTTDGIRGRDVVTN